jgi:hypothetical protein
VELSEAIRRHTSGQKERLALAMLGASGPVLTEGQARKQFEDAVRAHKKAHGKITDSSALTESKALLDYLAQHSTVVDQKIVDRFVTGTEYALKESIRAASERAGRPLSPGEVFGLALELNGGDKFKATLAAHNTLRALARGRNDGLQAQVPPEKRYHGRRGDAFGARQADEYFEKYLQPIRGGRDEGGAWYHFFGMAAFSMTAGEVTAKAASNAEERWVSGDAKTDPLELYVDTVGADTGSVIADA